MSRPLFEPLLHQAGCRVVAEIESRHPIVFTPRPVTDWRGLKAGDRAQPLTDLGRRLLGLHVATTTPKES
ncbi:MAG: hypothetical protein ACK4JB_17415 [Reyranella sp.]